MMTVKTWILLLQLAHSHYPVAIEFDSKEHCNAARTTILERQEGIGYCLEK